jgi:hypothetical protein
VDDVDAALKKGDLKFTLDGYKLKGSWVLVRTGGRWGPSRGGGDRSWLLIKHRDDWAGDVDIAEFAPRSVKSDGDFEDILAADKPDVWKSNRPAKGGEAGEMLETIIARAAALKAGRAPEESKAGAPAKKPSATQAKGASAESADVKPITKVAGEKKPREKRAARAATTSGSTKRATKTPARRSGTRKSAP